MSMKFTGHRRGGRAGRRRRIARCCGSSPGRPAARATPTPTSTFQLEEGGGTIHTRAQITGKAASMGEGVVIGVLDALITDFTGKVGEL